MHSPSGVSVVIPLYNHERYVKSAIESVWSQGEIVREIIVVDDGSTDQSLEKVRELATKDQRIVFWTQPNQGAHHAINAGMTRATGEFVAILNSDDTYATGRLARLTAALDLDKGADIASSSIAFMDDNGAAVSNPWHAEVLADYKSRGNLGLSLMNGNFVMTTSNIVLRRSVLDTLGLFASLRYAHDLDFLLRAAARSTRLAFIDAPLVSYRLHATNTIKEDPARVKREWAVACAHYVHLVRTSVDFGDRGWLFVEEMLAILERHTLARAVQCCLLYFDRHPADTLERSRILKDPGFRSLLDKALS